MISITPWENNSLLCEWDWKDCPECRGMRLYRAFAVLGSGSASAYREICEKVERDRVPKLKIPLVDGDRVMLFRLSFVDVNDVELAAQENPQPYYFGERSVITWSVQKMDRLGLSARAIHVEAPEEISSSRLWLEFKGNSYHFPSGTLGKSDFVLPVWEDGTRLRADPCVTAKYDIQG